MTSAAPLLPINHDEAMQLALIKQSESNLARCYVALAAELADAKRELAITSGPVLLANKMLVERDAASIARIATLEKSLREIKFNAGNKTGYGLIWQIAALALGSEQETKGEQT